MATEIRKNPKKLNFFCSTSNSFKFLLDKHLKIYWRIFRRKSIRIYLEKQYGGFKMAAQKIMKEALFSYIDAGFPLIICL